MTSAFWMGLCLCLLTGPFVVIDADPGQGANLSGPDAPVLSLRDCFKLPIGPRGLEPTDTLLRLRDQRVRVQGYMIKEEQPVPGLFMLTPTPVTMAELADGPADYLPAATLFVHLSSTDAHKILTYRPGLWAVSGLLRLGAQQEPHGRVSYVRVLLDDLQSVSTPDNQPLTCLDEDVRRHGHHH